MKSTKKRNVNWALAQRYTPDRVLDIAYCFYLASDNEQMETPAIKVARQVVSSFKLDLEKSRHSTSEHTLLASIGQIIVSLSRGISRRNKTREERGRAIEEEKNQRIREIKEGTKRTGFLKSALKTLLIGGFGYFISKLISPEIEWQHEGNPTAFSFASGIGLVLISSFISSWITAWKVAEIFHIYHHLIDVATYEYQKGALEEYERARYDANMAWRKYTGQEPRKWPGFEMVLRGDLNGHKTFAEEREIIEAHPLQKLISYLGSWRKKGRQEEKEEKSKE